MIGASDRIANEPRRVAAGLSWTAHAAMVTVIGLLPADTQPIVGHPAQEYTPPPREATSVLVCVDSRSYASSQLFVTRTVLLPDGAMSVNVEPLLCDPADGKNLSSTSGRILFSRSSFEAQR